MKILVTGANGLLGSNVVRELLKRGADVRVLLRKSCCDSSLADLSIERFYGDVTNRDDVLKAVQSCEIVIHIAASTCVNLNHVDKYKAINIDPADYLIEASEKFNIKRIIYVSSAATLGYGSIYNPGNEECRTSFEFGCMPYIQSKKIAQEKFLIAAEEGKLDVIVVNPSFIIGEFDSKPSSGKIILMSYKKKLVFVAPGGKNFVYAGDAAIAISNAISMGRSGECYLLTNENLSFKNFYRLVDKVSKRRSLKINLSKPVLKVAGILGSTLSFLGINTSATLANLRTLCVEQYYDNSKAVRELKMPTTPINQAIRASVEWFIDNGYIPADNDLKISES